MRSIRCIYNKGVYNGEAVYIHQLFYNVYTGIESLNKKAIAINELQLLLNGKIKSVERQEVQTAANIMFQSCGIPFVDFAHLKRENIKD